MSPKAQAIAEKVRALHDAMSQSGPVERTGRALTALAEACDPVRQFAKMWQEVPGPFGRKQAVIAAIEAGLEYLENQ